MTDPAPLELIEVPIDALANPSKTLILADPKFVATLKTVEAQVASLKITDAHSAQEAADLQQRLTGAGKALNAQRLALKRPFMDMEENIDKAAKAPLARIDALKATLSRLQTMYATEQATLQRQAEERRQAELRALERRRQEEAAAEAAKVAELQRQADEAAKQAAASGVQMLDDEEAMAEEVAPPTETEQAIAVLQAAPVVVAPKPSGVRFKITLEPTVTDVNKLPDIFIQKVAKLQAIKGAFCVGFREGDPLPMCAGVFFEVRKEVQSTGRGAF